ncbi:MAG: hypothetical protein K5989_03565, partial [Lachnospiraceae bacterium]|nr:hypothetical protein [Lachnospiraceae bacterium]
MIKLEQYFIYFLKSFTILAAIVPGEWELAHVVRRIGKCVVLMHSQGRRIAVFIRNAPVREDPFLQG